MKCPDCKDGKILGLFPVWGENVPEEDRKPFVEITCPRCNGTTEVPDEMTEWIDQGRILRERRLAKRITLRKACQKLGVDVVILSDMECGKIPPDMSIDY